VLETEVNYLSDVADIGQQNGFSDSLRPSFKLVANLQHKSEGIKDKSPLCIQQKVSQ
jgi:hypothetical protein